MLTIALDCDFWQGSRTAREGFVEGGGKSAGEDGRGIEGHCSRCRSLESLHVGGCKDIIDGVMEEGGVAVISLRSYNKLV